VVAGDAAGPPPWEPRGERLWRAEAGCAVVLVASGIGCLTTPLDDDTVTGWGFAGLAFAAAAVLVVCVVISIRSARLGRSEWTYRRPLDRLDKPDRRRFQRALRRGERVEQDRRPLAVGVAHRLAWQSLVTAGPLLIMAAGQTPQLGIRDQLFGRWYPHVIVTLMLAAGVALLWVARRYRRASIVNRD
jgi:hypothetical protein